MSKAKNKESCIIYSLDEIDRPIDLLLNLMKSYRIFCFKGDLGAGKTTIIKLILRASGVKDIITSPTYTYINCYQNDNNQIFYHFDLYRINSVKEFLEFNFDEYLYQPNSWVFIEWPEVIESLLSKGKCDINIEYEGSDIRKLCYN